MRRFRKGFTESKPFKSHKEKFLEPLQVKSMLQNVEELADPLWRRDHALIYASFFLGLRVGEAVRLRREHFRDLDRGIVYVPTLKSAPRILFSCTCGRRLRVSMDRAGQDFPCPRCGVVKKVANPGLDPAKRIPEKVPPVVEPTVRQYFKDYLAILPEEQQWLFAGQGRERFRISTTWARSLFNTYAKAAGLSPIYSFHSLRHGRGVVIYDAEGRVADVRDFLRQKTIAAAEIYTHMSKRTQETMCDTLDRIAQDFGENHA